MTEELHIVDCEIDRIVGSYPEMNDDSFSKIIRLYYLMYNKEVQHDDFKSVAKDDGDKTKYVHGPIITSAVSRKTAAVSAINMFIVDTLRLPFKPLPVPTYEVGAIRHVHFIEWKFYQRETLKQMKKDFWSCNSRIKLDSFMFVHKRPKDDIAVCTHNLSSDLGTSLDAKRLIEVHKHIRECLGNREYVTEEANTIIEIQNAMYRMDHPWRNIDDRKMQRDEILNLERWRSEHPYFARFGYVRDIIPLSLDEKSRFSNNAAHMKWIEMIETGHALTTGDAHEFATELLHKISKMHQNYTSAGYDTFPFIYHHSFTLAEMIKFYAAPPPPRAAPGAVLSYTQSMQDSATSFAKALSLMTVVASATGKSTTKGTNVLLLQISDPSVRALVEQNFSSLGWKILKPNEAIYLDNPDTVSYFLYNLAAGWKVPHGSMTSGVPIICNKQHNLYPLFNPSDSGNTTKRSKAK